MAGTPNGRARRRWTTSPDRPAAPGRVRRRRVSLRAVARDLGVVSSAVYRYVKSRDELLTLLVVDGYDELGEAVETALAEVPRGDYRNRFLIGRAMRAWALAEPATYALCTAPRPWLPRARRADHRPRGHE